MRYNFRENLNSSKGNRIDLGIKNASNHQLQHQQKQQSAGITVMGCIKGCVRPHVSSVGAGQASCMRQQHQLGLLQISAALAGAAAGVNNSDWSCCWLWQPQLEEQLLLKAPARAVVSGEACRTRRQQWRQRTKVAVVVVEANGDGDKRRQQRQQKTRAAAAREGQGQSFFFFFLG